MALTKITGEGLGSLGTGNLTHGSDSGDTRFTLNSANQYTLVLKNAGNIAGQIGGSGSDVLRFSNAAGATIMEMNAGHVTMPYQPAFQARPSSTLTDIAINTNVSLNFADEIFDRNADFNAGGSPSTFTAPVTGVYQLNLNTYILNLDTASTYLQISIITSNRSYDLVIDPNFSSDLTFYHMTLSALADMDAGDTAYIQAYQSGGTAQTDISAGATFSGYLVA